MIQNELIERISATRLRMNSRVTDFSFYLDSENYIQFSGDHVEQLKKFGISFKGNPDCTFIIPVSVSSYGNVSINNHGSGSIIFLGEQPNAVHHSIGIRLWGSRNIVLFPKFVASVVLPEVLLRSDDQILFWGINATSVWSKIEVEGQGMMVAVGDDCMLSTGVWIRNHDMHVIFDVESNQRVNAESCDVFIERHVWLGFDSFILGAPRIGYGSIIGTRTLVRDAIPPKSLVVGSPAKIVRSGVSWGRDTNIIPGWLKSTFDKVEKLDPSN